MNLLLSRQETCERGTVGRLYADGEFLCWTLENPKHKKKIWGDTRIPAGVYNIKLRTAGKFHRRYKKRFPDIHKGMLHLQDVPNFKYILIHCGNSKKDTHGCILTGDHDWLSSGILWPVFRCW